MRSAAFALFLFACGGGSKPAEQTTPLPAPVVASAGPTCDVMSGHMLDVLAQGKPVPPDDMKKMHDLFAAHCEKDAWTPQAKQCFSDMKTMDDGNKCADALTQAQKDAMDKEMGDPKGPPPGGAPVGGSRGAKGGDPQDGGE